MPDAQLRHALMQLESAGLVSRRGTRRRRLSQRHPQITEWLDANCGAKRWTMTPSGLRDVLNDTLSIDFGDALANVFVAR